MDCLECEGKTIVMETRTLASGVIVRRRKCKLCGCLGWTLEEYIDYDDIKEGFIELHREFRMKRIKEKYKNG